MQNENYILICSFNFFIDFDDVSMKYKLRNNYSENPEKAL